MAGIQLTPPEPFNMKNPDDWPRWRRRFEQFRVASGLADGDKQKQITMLLYCLGEESESVLKSTKPTEEQLKEYDTVLKKFDEFFDVRKTSYTRELASTAETSYPARLQNSIDRFHREV